MQSAYKKPIHRLHRFSQILKSRVGIAAQANGLKTEASVQVCVIFGIKLKNYDWKEMKRKEFLTEIGQEPFK